MYLYDYPLTSLDIDTIDMNKEEWIEEFGDFVLPKIL